MILYYNKQMEEFCVDKSKVSLKKINVNIAKPFVVKNHYSHSWTMCSLAIGIFYSNGKDHDFFDTVDDTLIGVMVYGNPVGRSAAASFSESVKLGEVWELTRLVILDGYGKNIESYCIAQSQRFIKKYYPKIKVILSYSDCEQGHLGGIYKATNAYYQGCGNTCLMPNFSVSLTNDPYDWIHSRTVFEKYGSHNLDKLKKAIGKTFWRKQESGKHRYFWILSDKRIRKQILSTLKHPLQPYPKSNDGNVFDVEEHIVEDTDDKNTFF